MKVLLSLALLLLSSTLSIAQDTQSDKCPTISVSSPPGPANLGELATYSAAVSSQNTYPIEYVWSIHGGRIKDGQGTGSVRVIRQADTLTVTVEVKGLPERCPTSVSETAIYDAAPDPIKIYELEPNAIFDRAVATRVAAVMLENPNNQLYILAGDVGRKNSPAFRAKQRAITDLLTKHGITQDRIAIASVYSDVELFQFWRVPPGANNPTCKECDELEQARSECPEISVLGPAGVINPGEDIVFVATLTGTAPERVSYAWAIDNGEIVKGQGTLKLTVHDKRRWGGSVNATLTVSGLPEACPRTASEVYTLVVDPGPEKIGSITDSTYTIGNVLLGKIASSLREEPNSQLYVWVYVGSDKAKFYLLKTHLLGQLSRTKIDPSRFTIEGTSESGRGAVFWRIRPGVSYPNP
jgi:hypothetical protein